jgi:DNA invertase Pin-like site-specific DNA recombinase
MLAALGVAAKFERRRIMRRTALGRVDAKIQRAKFGRKPNLTEFQRRKAIRHADVAEEPLWSIAHSFNVSAATISRLSP